MLRLTEIDQFRGGASSHITAIITEPSVSAGAACLPVMCGSRFGHDGDEMVPTVSHTEKLLTALRSVSKSPE